MGRVIHFDLEAQNPERAIQFYEEVFDWNFTKWDGPMEYWLIQTGPEEEPGIHGGLARTESEKPLTTNTIGVKNLDATLEKIKSLGGKVVRDKGPIKGVGWIAYVLDTEGNYFGVIEEDETVG